MAGQLPILEVRGGKVRCSGRDGAPHPDAVLDIPIGATVACPHCGRRYRRASLWNLVSAAIWPATGRGR